MILSVDELKEMSLFSTMSDKTIERKILAVESAICAYTNNPFKTRSKGIVTFPPDVQEGALQMLIYDQTVKKKTGIKSESLSRHNVTYFDMDGENSIIGYPKALIGFLKPYMKARF